MTRDELTTKLEQLVTQARAMVDGDESIEAIERITQEIEQTRAKLDQLDKLEAALQLAYKVEPRKSAPARDAQASTLRTLDDVAAAIVQSADFRNLLQSRKGRWVAQTVTIPTPTYEYSNVAPALTPSASLVGTLVSVGTRANAISVYARETTTSVKGSAAAVSKGSAKPTTTQTYESVQSVAQTLAHLLKLSEQDLQDIPGLQTVIQQRGLRQLLAAEEDQVVNGDGTAPDLTGLLTVTGTTSSTQGTDTLVDAIIKGIATLAGNGGVPSAIAVSYSTWAALQTAKDSTGAYLLPASVAAGIGNVRGVPLVASPFVPTNKVIIGDNRQATLWRVGGLAIEVDRTGDDFASNLVTLRIEERCALDVYQPRGFHIVTLA